jgi:sirohydrochlorin cobaltochelatase
VFKDDAVLLVGHGSARYPDAGDIQRRHAEALRATGHFRQVETALLAGEPTVAESLTRIAAPRVHVVPFFMEDGYFVRVAVPRALGGDRRCRICAPIGLHPAMADLIQLQAERGCQALRLPAAHVAVLVAGHGSAQVPGRALVMYEHALAVGRQKQFASVQPACLEESPFLSDALAELRQHPVVVTGYFAGGGGHVRDDVPAAVAAEQAARGSDGAPIRFCGSVTADPGMLRIIQDQIEGG